MRQRLYQRLQGLEAHQAVVQAQTDSREREARLAKYLERVRLFMRVCGVEQGPRESLMEAWARALGISSRELRAQIQEGIDPIQKYLRDHGVYEEIARKKAAGTWPSG